MAGIFAASNFAAGYFADSRTNFRRLKFKDVRVSISRIIEKGSYRKSLTLDLLQTFSFYYSIALKIVSMWSKYSLLENVIVGMTHNL